MSFLGCKKSRIKKSGLFDEKYYLLHNPDVRVADTNPLRHYINIGWREGRNPSAQFDTKFYLKNNPDVELSGKNPLLHYIKYGQKEGRQALPSASSSISFSSSQRSKPGRRRLFTTNNFRQAKAYIKKFGFSFFLKKVKSVLFPGRAYKHFSNISNIEKPQDKQKTVYKPVQIEHIDKKVSIIIPTKNAGPEFAFLMKVLKLQEGFREIEIVIVDSGSTDNTVGIARNNNAVVVEIKPSEFTHSHARNLGAENASGDYLLFTVQDALPPSSTWLYELFQVLKNEEVVAVSCAETPRQDADLFYRQICWNHYNFLGVNENDRIFSLPENIDYISLRQNGQLSDLANLISREVFEKYRYRLNYAEDLDLGIRLIKDGYKIAFLGSVRIIHSHNRLPWYFLKRGYVDNQFLSDVFDDFPIPKISMPSFIPDVAFTYKFLNHLIDFMNTLPNPLSPELFENKVSEFFEQRYQFNFPSELPVINEQYLDPKAQYFIEELIKTSGFQYAGQRYDGFLTTALLGHVNISFNYLKNTYELIDQQLMLEVKECFSKAFSILVGAHLAYCNKNRTGDELQDMDQLHQTLMEGV